MSTRALLVAALVALPACAAGAAEDEGESRDDAVSTCSGACAARPTVRARTVRDDAIVVDGAIDPAWSEAEPVTFATDWSGASTATRTQVRILRSDRALYMLWELEGAKLDVDTSRSTSVERDKLYEEDCVEVFLAPDPEENRRYFEIEVGPMGHYFDLVVDRRTKKSDVAWSSQAEIRTEVDRARGKATIELALRSPDLVKALRPGATLPIGLYRIEGRSPRQYLAWSPTRSARPNFHVPDAFGTLVVDGRR